MALKMTPNTMQQLIKSDRNNTFTSSDDNIMLKQILGTHSPDGREIDVRPLLHIVEDILTRATLHVDTMAPGVEVNNTHMPDALDEKAHQAGAVGMLDALSYIIDRIACELACKCLGGGDGHQTTVSLFTVLSNYSWEAKMVLTLAAFALNYGEFWLLAQIYSSNPLAKSMAILKQLPVIMEHSGSLKPRFDALNILIKAMLDLAGCIVAFKELPSTYVSHEVPAYSTAMATVPTAVYWVVRGVVACATQITSLTSLGHELYIASTMEAWELSTLAHKINNIHDHLRKQLEACHLHMDEKRNVEAYESLLHMFDTIHIDNVKILKALVYSKDDLQPLYDCSAKLGVNYDVLKGKNVLLLISDLDISQDELSILKQIYNESRESRQIANRMDSLYEVLWIPIVDQSMQRADPMHRQSETAIPGDPMHRQPETSHSTIAPMHRQPETLHTTMTGDPMQRQFETLQLTMPWYSVYHPSTIDPKLLRFVKERCHFRNKPILVVLDPLGRVVSPNAIHMMWIWGSKAFPFTSLREEALWKEESWRVELLVNGIDPTILGWIREGKYILLYGGDDIEWIRRFTSTARNMAQVARIPLEMVYVGKSAGKREKVRRMINIIETEKLSHTWQDLMIWFFWTRLESMLLSKIQLGQLDDNDPMIQEIKKLLSFDKNGGWAVLSHGSEVFVNGHGTTVVPAMSEYDIWKEHVPTKGFERSLRDHHNMLHGASHPCCRFVFPSAAGRIPEYIKCPECLRHMDKYTTFICCHDEITTLF